jgi:hypothetical protein
MFPSYAWCVTFIKEIRLVRSISNDFCSWALHVAEKFTVMLFGCGTRKIGAALLTVKCHMC